MIWLVSRRFDLWMFLAPALVALLLVPLGPLVAPTGETPLPMWFLAVLMVDVAHVWATLYRTYLDRAELRRRPLLYAGAPLLAYGFGLMLASISFAAFWTGLAYLAVFHFVRQQYGWVALYNRRDPKTGPLDRGIDTFTIYAATLFPLLWWHANLPRAFDWFLPGDFFFGLVPPGLVRILWPIYLGSFVVFAARQLQRRIAGEAFRLGKIVVVTTTALCWGVGIVVSNTDWAFTVTNVLIHGVPYFGIVWVACKRSEGGYRRGSLLHFIFRGGRILPFYGILVLLAYTEELGWDRLFWHSAHGLFPGPALRPPDWAALLLLPLLALPQVTHYLLDGFIWKTSAEKNPVVSRVMRQLPADLRG